MEKFIQVPEEVNRNVLRALSFLCGEHVKVAMHTARITEQVKFQMKGLVPEDELDEAVPESLYILSAVGVIERHGLNLFAIGNFKGAHLNPTETTMTIPRKPNSKTGCSPSFPSGELVDVCASSTPKNNDPLFDIIKKCSTKSTKIPYISTSVAPPPAPPNTPKRNSKMSKSALLNPYEGQHKSNSLADCLPATRISEQGYTRGGAHTDVTTTTDPHVQLYHQPQQSDAKRLLLPKQFQFHFAEDEEMNNKTEIKQLPKRMNPADVAQEKELKDC